MKVYAVMHSDCIYESAASVISLHSTKHGAVRAMIKFKFAYIADRAVHGLGVDLDWFGYRVFEINDLAEYNNPLELSARQAIERSIMGSLRSSIKAHGPITEAFLPSASKRVFGGLKQLAKDWAINKFDFKRKTRKESTVNAR